MTNAETPNDEGMRKLEARNSQLARYRSDFVPGRFRHSLFGLLSSFVVRSSFKTGSQERMAGVDGHTSAAWVGEPPESSDLGAHFVRPQPPDMGFETGESSSTLQSRVIAVFMSTPPLVGDRF